MKELIFVLAFFAICFFAARVGNRVIHSQRWQPLRKSPKGGLVEIVAIFIFIGVVIGAGFILFVLYVFSNFYGSW